MTIARRLPRKQRRFATIVKTSVLRRRCPRVRFQASWCRGICSPHNGLGQCGLPAPHAMRGRLQRAIAAERQEGGEDAAS